MKQEKNNCQTSMDEETLLKNTPKSNIEKQTQKTIAANDGKKKNNPLWQSVLVGGIPGILVGVGAMAGATEAFGGENVDLETDSDTQTEENAEIPVAHSVSNEMSFGEAFAAARAELGPGGVFVWRGNIYETYRSNDPEWANMTPEEYADRFHQVMNQVHVPHYDPQPDDPTIVPINPDEGNLDEGNPGEGNPDEGNPDEGNPDEGNPGEGNPDEGNPDEGNPDEGNPGEGNPDEGNLDEGNSGEGNPDEGESGDSGLGDVDVHIVGVETIDGEDGAFGQVGYGTANGHDAVFIDSNGDDEIETVMIDTNDNGELDNNETFDVEGSGMSMDNLMDEPSVDCVEPADDSILSEMPDYTNDADTSDLC